MIDLTIIIPTLNASGDVEQDKKIEYSRTQCLKSLGETVPDIPIVLVSNGIGYKYIPTSWNKNLVRINIEDQGQCKAVNAAVATVKTEYIMVTNDDMIFPPGWLEDLLDFSSYHDSLATDFKINCVSPQLVEPNNGAPTFIKYFCGGAGGDFDRDKFYDYVENRSLSNNIVRRGFNFPLLIKKEVFDIVGGYDIKYDPWGASSDTDLQCKIELSGIKTYQNTKCNVYHFSQTSGTFHPSKHGYWQKNYNYFREKWGFERPGDPDVWFSNNLIDYDNLKFNPWWKGFYDK